MSLHDAANANANADAGSCGRPQPASSPALVLAPTKGQAKLSVTATTDPKKAVSQSDGSNNELTVTVRCSE